MYVQVDYAVTFFYLSLYRDAVKVFEVHFNIINKVMFVCCFFDQQVFGNNRTAFHAYLTFRANKGLLVFHLLS